MNAVSDKARLVSTLEGPSLTVAVARSEILDVLRSNEEPELVLEVVRTDRREAEPELLRFDWDRDELAALLRNSEGDAVTLMFDESAIERALARGEVEAHGLREKAVVLAVVAATATATAGAAAAPAAGGHPAPPPRGPIHPAEGTGFIPTPGTERTPPPRGARHPAEGTGFVPTPTGAPRLTDSSPQTFETTGAIAAGAAVLITGLGFAARGRHREPTVRPA
jgi:hypothetical protein